MSDQRARYVPYIRHRNFGCRVAEFTFHRLRCVTLENRSLRVTIAADKGADIFEFLHKPTDTELLLRTPLGLKAADPLPPTIDLREGAFTDFYEGGWQELFPVAGDFPAEHKGAQFGQHGEVALLPWDYQIEEDQPERVAVKFSVQTTRTPFLLERTMILEGDAPVLKFRERIVNEGDEALEFMWAHHPAFGWPFLDEISEIHLPRCEVVTVAGDLPTTSRLIEQVSEWPRVRGKNGETIDLSRMPPPETKAHDLAFLRGFDAGHYEVRSPRRGLSFHLRWPIRTFPHLWYWQVTRGAFGYPWYGTTYNLALEPHSSLYPMLPKALETGHALRLAAGQELTAELEAEIATI